MPAGVQRPAARHLWGCWQLWQINSEPPACSAALARLQVRYNCSSSVTVREIHCDGGFFLSHRNNWRRRNSCATYWSWVRGPAWQHCQPGPLLLAAILTRAPSSCRPACCALLCPQVASGEAEAQIQRNCPDAMFIKDQTDYINNVALPQLQAQLRADLQPVADAIQALT